MALAIAHFLITSRSAISSSEDEFPPEVGFIKFLPFSDFRAYTPRPTVRPLEMDAGRRYIKVARLSVPLGAATVAYASVSAGSIRATAATDRSRCHLPLAER